MASEQRIEMQADQRQAKDQRRHHRRGGEGGIQPVQRAAMAGDQPARVLGAEATLDEGFKQVAAMRRRC